MISSPILTTLLLILLLRFQPCQGLIELQTLKSTGTFFQQSNQKTISAGFLSKGRLEVIENNKKDSNVVILCDILPLPLAYESGRDLFYSRMLNSQMQPSLFDVKSDCNILLNRDNGIFDNLPYNWVKGYNARKEIYNFLNGGQGIDLTGQNYRFSNLPTEYRNGHLAFQYALKTLLNIQITGLLLETIDESKDTINIGGAILISKNNVSNQWQLSSTNNKLPNQENNENACLINCHIDELLGFSLALGLPICTNKNLFENACMDVLMTKDITSNKLLISAPYNNQQFKNKDTKSSTLNKNTETKTALAAWEIFNPQVFLDMSMVEKRAVLRASKVKNLPRPREGETKRQSLLRQMGEALDAGDMEAAEKLRESFMMLSALKADPTQVEGSYSRFLDQDDWYMEARRKAMAPKKK
eukprot:gene6212-12582_t